MTIIMLKRDVRYDNVIVSNSLVVPSTRDVTSTHLNPTQGSFVYNEDDDEVYIGNGTAFLPVQGGGGAVTTLNNAGGFETLVNDGVGPVLATKGLTAGTNITLDSDATSITINATGGGDVTLASVGAGETLVNDGVGPALANKSLVAGTNVTLDSDATTVTINADGGGGGDVTLASVGAGETLVNDGVGPALANKSLVAGTNVTLASDATTVTINSAGGTGATYVPFTPAFGTHTNFVVNEVINAQFAHYGAGSGSYVHFTMMLDGVVGLVDDVIIQFGLPTPGAPLLPNEIPLSMGPVSVIFADNVGWVNGTVASSTSGSPIHAHFTSTEADQASVHISGSYTLA
jgi:hypothetical protein